MKRFMTMKEVAAYLRLSTQSIKRMIQDGRLVAHKIGPCSYRITEDAVGALLSQTLSRAFVDELTDFSADFDKWVYDFINNCVISFDWVNNEGGQGNVSINLETGECSMEGSQNVAEERGNTLNFKGA